jgi:signal transduction histidine kinase
MSKRKCFWLQTKLGIAFSTLVITTSALLTLALFLTARQRLREDIYRRLQNIVGIAALQVDGDMHSSLVDSNQEGSNTYLHIKWALQKIRDSSPGIRYIYTWRFNRQGELVFVVDYGDRLNEEAKNELGMIVTKAERMGQLLDGMLEYCRLQLVMENCSQVDTNKVVSEVLANINPPDNVKITVENELPVIDCEFSHAVLLFRHLIAKAVKFIDKPKGQIKIACSGKDGFWRFSVSDNGPGIEQRHYRKIFKLFQTLDSHDNGTGMGLGLTIAKKIVEMYQGGRVGAGYRQHVLFRFAETVPQRHARQNIAGNNGRLTSPHDF